MSNTQKNIRKEERRLKRLGFGDLLNSITDDEVAGNSLMYAEFAKYSNTAEFLAFAKVLGRFEIAQGEIFRLYQRRVNLTLQLLQVLMNADTQLQLVEVYKKLKKHKDALPQLVRSVVGGMIGGQMQQAAMPLMPLPAAPAVQSVTEQYTTYPWSDAAKAPNGPAPIPIAPVYLNAFGQASLGAIQDDAIGVAVSVDPIAYTVTVATNGQKITGIEEARLKLAAPGSLLVGSHQPALTTQRYLITKTEALALGFLPGTNIKPIARVLKNDSNERTIVVVDQTQITLPTP